MGKYEDLYDDPDQIYFLRRWTPDDDAPVTLVIGPCVWAEAWWVCNDMVPGFPYVGEMWDKNVTQQWVLSRNPPYGEQLRKQREALRELYASRQ